MSPCAKLTLALCVYLLIFDYYLMVMFVQYIVTIVLWQKNKETNIESAAMCHFLQTKGLSSKDYSFSRSQAPDVAFH